MALKNMIKKFESFKSDKDLSEKMEDLEVLKDIFTDIEDECLESQYFYIGPKFDGEVTYYTPSGQSGKSRAVEYSEQFRIDLAFSWESEEEFQKIMIDIIKHIQRSKIEGFEFLYETRKLSSKSNIEMEGICFYFEDLFKKNITPNGKVIKPVEFGEEPGDEMFMSFGDVYTVMLYFKKL